MKEFTHECFEDHNVKIMLPTNKIVCPTCGGEGRMSRTDIDSSMIYDNAQEDGDFDTMEAVRRGDFMTHCTTCNGNNVVDEMDMEYFANQYPKEYTMYIHYLDCAWDSDATQEAERRMGA